SLLPIALQDGAILTQVSVERGRDIQDVLRLDDRTAYVSALHSCELPQIDFRTGERITTIDLSVYRDADGSCELTDLALEGKTALVLAQRLENFFPTRSYVLQIDTLTHQLIGDIVLDGREGRAPSNPVG